MKRSRGEGCLSRRVDGGFAWIVFIAVLLSHAILGGFCLSGGIFYVIFRNAFGSSPVSTSWLCSLPITMWFISMPIGSFLINRYDCRTCAFLGSIISGTGITMCYFAPNIEFMFVSYGLLAGSGFGIMFTAITSVINEYFDKYKTVTSGIANAGMNVGLIIYAKLIVYLEEIYGWRGSMLIIGGLTYNTCVLAALMLPFPIRTEKSSAKNEVGELLYTEKNVLCEQEMNCTHVSETSFTRNKKKLLNCSIFKKFSFICLCASCVLVNAGQGVYILHIPSYSETVGFTEDDIGTVLMVWGVANVVGKIFFSLLGHHPNVDVLTLYGVALAATGVSIGLTPFFLSRAGMLVLPCSVGFFFSVAGALLYSAIFAIVGYERFSDGVGLSHPFKASGNLIGGPIAGVLYATTGNYRFSFYLGGVMMFLSGALMVPPILQNRKRSSPSATILDITSGCKAAESCLDGNLTPDCTSNNSCLTNCSNGCSEQCSKQRAAQNDTTVINHCTQTNCNSSGYLMICST